MINKLLKILFGTHQWNILYKEKNSKKWIKLAQPKNISRADPFLVKYQDSFYIFFEEFKIGEGLGYLCSANLDTQNKKIINKKIILKKKYHLSFPFVFKYKNRYYLIPETSKEERIDLYEFVSFPNKLRFVRTLLNGFKAADSILYKDKNIWFLLTNLERSKNDLNTRDLSIFQSDCLLNGTFVQKHNNPVVSDIRYARNGGGIIYVDNNLFRVSQDCKKRYGHKVNIMKVISLTEYNYKEIPFKKIKPPKGYIAFHTYNICDDIVIGDGKVIKKDIKTLFTNFIKLLSISIGKIL